MAQKITLDLAINNADAVSSIRDAKTALKDLKSAMAFGVDEKDTESIRKAEEAYKKLKDKVDDVNDSLKANADEGLTQVGNQFKYVKDRIFELDFTKAKEGLKSLGTTVKGISFGQIKEGIKTFGSSLGELGTVMKTALGPWGLLILAVTAVIGFLYSLKDVIKPIGQLFAWLGGIVESVVKFFTDLTDAMGLTTVARDKENESIRNSAELNENAIKGSYNRQIEMLEKLHKNSSEIRLQMTRELIAQYDKERKAASDAFNDIAAKEQYKKQKTKEYYEALTKFQEINQKRSQEMQNIDVIKLAEKERLEKNAFEVSVQMDKAKTDAKLVNIKNETTKAFAAENAAYAASLKAKKEAQKTDGKTEDEHNQEIEALTISHNAKLLEINKTYREKEKQAGLDFQRTQISLIELEGKKDIETLTELKNRRIAIVDAEETDKLSKVKKGSEQYNAILANSLLQRKQIEEQYKQSVSQTKTETSNATVEFLKASVTALGDTDGATISNLLTAITKQQFDNAKRLLDESKNKLGDNLYNTLLNTLNLTKEQGIKEAEKTGKKTDLLNQQANINKKIAQAELEALKAKNDLKFDEEQKYLTKIEELKKQGLLNLKQLNDLEANNNADKLAKNKAEYEKSLEEIRLSEESSIIKSISAFKNKFDTIQRIVENITNGIFDLLDAFENQSNEKGDKMTAEEEKRAKARFEIHKAFSLAAAVIQGALNVQGAWEGIAKAANNPLKMAFAIANLVAVVGTNVLTISKIAQTQYKAASTGAGGASGSASAAGSQTPNVNLYGSGGQTNNLTAQNMNQRDNNIKVVVLESDITNAQTNVGRYKVSASLS